MIKKKSLILILVYCIVASNFMLVGVHAADKGVSVILGKTQESDGLVVASFDDVAAIRVDRVTIVQ